VISPAAVGRFTDDVGKHRPCVVLHATEEAIVLAYGTSTAGRDYAFVLIGERDVSGRALRLTGPTFFYKPNVIALPASSERIAIFPLGRCTPAVLLQLRALAEFD